MPDTDLITKALALGELGWANQHAALLGFADEVLQRLDEATGLLPTNQAGAPLFLRLALKLAVSRAIVLALHKPLKIGVVFAMYGEQNRLQPRSEDNPFGEDALNRKISEMEWLCRGSMLDFRIYAVDDGCPRGSGRVAEAVVRASNKSAQTQVHFLERELPLEGELSLQSAESSVKGGSIALGAIMALRDECDAVISTDADTSVNIAQAGLLIEHYVAGHQVVLGSRMAPESVVVKNYGRFGPGVKVLRHIQKLIATPIREAGIVDTQAAFKLYDGKLLGTILGQSQYFDLSFDTEWILLALRAGTSVATVPIAFIDSPDESSVAAMGGRTVWSDLLRNLKGQLEFHGIEHDRGAAALIARWFDSPEKLDLVLPHKMPRLASATENELGDSDFLSTPDIERWLEGLPTEHAGASA